MNHLTPQQVHDTLQDSPNALLIDCRTEIEYYYVGHPTDAVNIEWNSGLEFEINPHFSDQVLRMAGRKDTGRSSSSTAAASARSMPGWRWRSTVSATLWKASRASSTRSTTCDTLGGWRMRGLPWRQL